MEGPTHRESGRSEAARRQRKCWLPHTCLAAAWLAALTAGGQLIPPVVDDWARGGLTDVEDWTAASNNAGRVTLVPPTPLADFSAAGTSFSNTTYFRGNTYEAGAGEKTLLGHELFLDRDSPVEVTFCVYESANTNGPFLRIDAVTVYAPAGTGFIGSGQRGVPLRSGKFYAIGAAVNESSSYQRLSSVSLPFDCGELTCLKGIASDSVPGASVTSFSTYSNPYRQRLRVAGGYDSVPGKLTITQPMTTTYMRGNIFEATNSTWLLGHGLYLAGADTGKTVNLFVYESNTRTGVYTRLDLQSVTASAGATNYVSAATQLPLAAGKFYLLGGQSSDGISVHYASSYYDTPQGFDWGQAIEGFSRSGAPPETVTKAATTNETVYRACVMVGDRPAVRMDASSSPAMSTNSLTVEIASYGYSDVTLAFDYRESADESQDGDGVFVSADGTTFTRVMVLDGTTTWEHYETNIIALAQAAGVSTSSRLHIRFQQQDDYSWGTDGREFANIRLYAKPDLAWSSLAASPTNYLFRGAVSKTIFLSGATRVAGGDTAVTGQTVSVRHRLYDDQGTVQYTYSTYTPDIPAYAHRLETFSASVVVPAGTLLTQNLYHATVLLDSGGALAEGRENNNTSSAAEFLVNHYSGVLRFSNTASSVTLTGWNFQSGYSGSPERHVITGSGTIGGHSFGFTNLMVRKQMSTCDYVIDPNETQVLFLPDTRNTTNTVSGVRFVLDSNVALSRHGVTAPATVFLPAGCAFTESSDKPWGVAAVETAADVQLDTNLRPTGSHALSPAYSCFYEESKPLFFEASGVTWNASAGTIAIAVSSVAYAHGAALDQLDGLAATGQIPLSSAVRRSNDGYYRSVTNATTLTLSRDAHGAGRLSFAVDIETNRFRAHMPYNVEIGWNKTGHLAVTNDLPVVSPLASELNDGLNFGVYYGSGCPGGCAGADNSRLLSCINEADAFYFTEDGGLYVPCSFTGGQADLKWGYIPTSGAFAQRASGFTDGILHVPGHFLCADDCPAALSDDDTPGALVLSAVGGAGDELVRPHGDGYADGDGNYAGVTVQWQSANCEGETLLGGKELLGPYTLDESCKLYVRQTGVSGIHVADSSLDQVYVTLYGYPIVLNNLAFSYLSTENLESRTEGRVTVPSPCDFSVDFEELKLTCMGDLESAEPADPSVKLTLAYWSALVQPSTIGFASEDSCDIGDRTLVMDVSTTVDNIPDTLFGRLGFLPDGNLSSAADAGAGGSSRLSLPTTVTLPGPEDSTYTLYPAASAYFNDYRLRGDLSAIGDGLLTFAAELDVPFFENMLVQAFTSADTSGGTSPVYLVGGWPSKGWTIGGQTPFTDAAFDAANSAHPTNAAAPAFSDYLAGANADYIPRARREWISGIGFDIGVRWDASSLSFRSPDPVENDLYVLQTEYNVPQLTAERAEITFGLTYGELPDLNLSSIFFNAVDEATGISDCLNTVVGETVTGALDSGVAALDVLTATDPAEMLGNTLSDQIDPFVDSLYVALTNAYATGSSVTNTIGRYIRGGAGAPANNLRHLLDQIVDGTAAIGTGLGVAEDMQDQIDKAIGAIDAVAVGVDDPEKGLISLLDVDAGKYQIVADLAQVLLIFAMPAMEDAADAIEEEIDGVMETLKPTLDSVRENLVEVRDQLDEVRSALDTAGEFRDELLTALDPAQLTDLADTVADRLDEEFAALEGPFSPAQNYSPEELKALIRATIIDALRESAPVAELQRIVRARMLDVDRQIRGGIDSALGQINWAMRETLSEVVGSLDTSISGMVGDFSDVLGTGQVEGYAHIAGDSLDKLRLDLQMQMKVPDEMQFAGYLEIVNEQTSASGGCAFDEGSTYKVTLGAEDVSCNWLGSDVRINCSCFFTLNDGVPKGMGGALELVDGTISFEAAEINRFGAAVAFGALENYLAAATRVTINDSVEMEGGLFFGRTCTMTPILIVDPEVGDVLGEPPFTGAYIYGEGWIPIYDYGCVFRIKAGAGFGVFYFAEGPTYGVHIMLGAEGEALCVVSVRGEVDIYGLKQGDSYRASGKGKIKGKVGSCPFCVKFNKTVTITYDDGEWDADY